MEDASTSLKLPKVKWPKSLSTMEDPVVPQIRERSIRTWLGKSSKLGMLIRTP